jgi:hypothetical protein
MRFSILLTILILLLLVLALNIECAGVVHNQICEYSKNCTCSPENLTSSFVFSFFSITSGDLQTVSIALSAIATVFIGWFTWKLRDSTDKLWKAGDDQLKHAKKSSQRDLRAYVGINQDPGAAKRYIKDGGKLSFQPVIVNYGKTPAYDLTVGYNIVFASIETGPTQFPIRNFKKPSRGTLFPTQSICAACESDSKFSFDEIENLYMNEEAIFLYGTIHYRDAFHKHGMRWTNFCYEIKLKGKRITGWHVTDSHNDSS